MTEGRSYLGNESVIIELEIVWYAGNRDDYDKSN